MPFSREIKTILQFYMEEYINKQAGYDLILNSLLTQLVVTLLRQIKNNLSNLDPKKLLSATSNIQRSIEYLRENYQNDYCMDDVAKVANLSPYHFIRMFKNQTGKTPYGYLLDIKIEKAKEMLKNKKELTITQICFMCGFNNVSHFTSLFKRKTGVSPSRYRKMLT